MAQHIKATDHDREVLRPLAQKIAQLAALPVQQETASMWRRMNDLDMVKPMVMIYQVCWNEMNVNDELTTTCEDPFLRTVETDFRRKIYQWSHMRGDMVIEPFCFIEPVIEGDDYGIAIEEDVIDAHPDSAAKSHHYIAQIKEERDVDKIQIPTISHNELATKERCEVLTSVFGDILPTQARINFGKSNMAPWDRLVHWTGVTEILTDLALRPEYVHALMEQLTRAHEARVDQFMELGLMELNNNAQIIGQGGYGYTKDLPVNGFKEDNVRFSDMWGGGMAQVFSEVSPEMHREFALDYEVRVMNRFGLVYYGCCEPLHNKIDLAKSMIPNLRKISMSPMADDKKGAEVIGNSLVYSCKPNPAFLATNRWEPDAVREEISTIFDATRANGCNVEIILKDISTVRHNPERLWDWVDLVTELTNQYQS